LLRSQDPSFALFVKTSASAQPSKKYPDELVLLTGFPSSPEVSARIDLLGTEKPHCPPTCGGLRGLAISPDGDTVLVPSDAHDEMISRLDLVRNVKKFFRSKNPADLDIRVFRKTEIPQLDNVSDVAFGPDGRWAVVSTAGPGPIDFANRTPRGTVVVISGLPDNPKFSAPFSVPMHSQGNIDLSRDGGALLLNDCCNLSDQTFFAPKSNQIVVRGIQPGGSPRVAGRSTFITPLEFTVPGPAPVTDARMSLDGRFVLAPIPLIRENDAQQMPVRVNQIVILGPVRNGKLETARLLTQSDGVSGGPFQAAVSPDGDSALVANVLDNGGAELLTGLSSGDPGSLKLKALPFPFFGPPFPLGPTGPPLLASHGQPVFTPAGDTALVVNWIIPPLAGTALSPSLSVLIGFQSGSIGWRRILATQRSTPLTAARD
jgi:hypothetical protein